MEKIGRPPKLIAYDSERNLELRAAGKAPAYRIVRPRTVLYATLLAVVGMVMLAVLILRPSVGLDVIPTATRSSSRCPTAASATATPSA